MRGAPDRIRLFLGSERMRRIMIFIVLGVMLASYFNAFDYETDIITIDGAYVGFGTRKHKNTLQRTAKSFLNRCPIYGISSLTYSGNRFCLSMLNSDKLDAIEPISPVECLLSNTNFCRS